jgi:hypothetical protein
LVPGRRDNRLTALTVKQNHRVTRLHAQYRQMARYLFVKFDRQRSRQRARQES